ncbi:hypothetical protein GGX14DRAFT_390709 [Mycena pura]|uniref:Uncharacterized protein n=1 Tax=Mycena pura TaxID=153505 RepID=A0AAD6VVH4_9AGAR|nr:hypothetical protein GGX14DRAFT_390709 [Mycena pura]
MSLARVNDVAISFATGALVLPARASAYLLFCNPYDGRRVPACTRARSSTSTVYSTGTLQRQAAAIRPHVYSAVAPSLERLPGRYTRLFPGLHACPCVAGGIHRVCEPAVLLLQLGRRLASSRSSAPNKHKSTASRATQYGRAPIPLRTLVCLPPMPVHPRACSLVRMHLSAWPFLELRTRHAHPAARSLALCLPARLLALEFAYLFAPHVPPPNPVQHARSFATLQAYSPADPPNLLPASTTRLSCWHAPLLVHLLGARRVYAATRAPCSRMRPAPRCCHSCALDSPQIPYTCGVLDVRRAGDYAYAFTIVAYLRISGPTALCTSTLLEVVASAFLGSLRVWGAIHFPQVYMSALPCTGIQLCVLLRNNISSSITSSDFGLRRLKRLRRKGLLSYFGGLRIGWRECRGQREDRKNSYIHDYVTRFRVPWPHVDVESWLPPGTIPTSALFLVQSRFRASVGGVVIAQRLCSPATRKLGARELLLRFTAPRRAMAQSLTRRMPAANTSPERSARPFLVRAPGTHTRPFLIPRAPSAHTCPSHSCLYRAASSCCVLTREYPQPLCTERDCFCYCRHSSYDVHMWMEERDAPGETAVHWGAQSTYCLSCTTLVLRRFNRNARVMVHSPPPTQLATSGPPKGRIHSSRDPTRTRWYLASPFNDDTIAAADCAAQRCCISADHRSGLTFACAPVQVVRYLVPIAASRRFELLRCDEKYFPLVYMSALQCTGLQLCLLLGNNIFSHIKSAPLEVAATEGNRPLLAAYCLAGALRSEKILESTAVRVPGLQSDRAPSRAALRFAVQQPALLGPSNRAKPEGLESKAGVTHPRVLREEPQNGERCLALLHPIPPLVVSPECRWGSTESGGLYHRCHYRLVWLQCCWHAFSERKGLKTECGSRIFKLHASDNPLHNSYRTANPQLPDNSSERNCAFPRENHRVQTQPGETYGCGCQGQAEGKDGSGVGCALVFPASRDSKSQLGNSMLQLWRYRNIVNSSAREAMAEEGRMREGDEKAGATHLSGMSSTSFSSRPPHQHLGRARPLRSVASPSGYLPSGVMLSGWCQRSHATVSRAMYTPVPSQEWGLAPDYPHVGAKPAIPSATSPQHQRPWHPAGALSLRLPTSASVCGAVPQAAAGQMRAAVLGAARTLHAFDRAAKLLLQDRAPPTSGSDTTAAAGAAHKRQRCRVSVDLALALAHSGFLDSGPHPRRRRGRHSATYDVKSSASPFRVLDVNHLACTPAPALPRRSSLMISSFRLRCIQVPSRQSAFSLQGLKKIRLGLVLSDVQSDGVISSFSAVASQRQYLNRRSGARLLDSRQVDVPLGNEVFDTYTLPCTRGLLWKSSGALACAHDRKEGREHCCCQVLGVGIAVAQSLAAALRCKSCGIRVCIRVAIARRRLFREVSSHSVAREGQPLCVEGECRRRTRIYSRSGAAIATHAYRHHVYYRAPYPAPALHALALRDEVPLHCCAVADAPAPTRLHTHALSAWRSRRSIAGTTGSVHTVPARHSIHALQHWIRTHRERGVVERLPRLRSAPPIGRRRHCPRTAARRTGIKRLGVGRGAQIGGRLAWLRLALLLREHPNTNTTLLSFNFDDTLSIHFASKQRVKRQRVMLLSNTHPRRAASSCCMDMLQLLRREEDPAISATALNAKTPKSTCASAAASEHHLTSASRTTYAHASDVARDAVLAGTVSPCSLSARCCAGSLSARQSPSPAPCGEPRKLAHCGWMVGSDGPGLQQRWCAPAPHLRVCVALAHASTRPDSTISVRGDAARGQHVCATYPRMPASGGPLQADSINALRALLLTRWRNQALASERSSASQGCTSFLSAILHPACLGGDKQRSTMRNPCYRPWIAWCKRAQRASAWAQTGGHLAEPHFILLITELSNFRITLFSFCFEGVVHAGEEDDNERELLRSSTTGPLQGASETYVSAQFNLVLGQQKESARKNRACTPADMIHDQLGVHSAAEAHADGRELRAIRSGTRGFVLVDIRQSSTCCARQAALRRALLHPPCSRAATAGAWNAHHSFAAVAPYRSFMWQPHIVILTFFNTVLVQCP